MEELHKIIDLADFIAKLGSGQIQKFNSSSYGSGYGGAIYQRLDGNEPQPLQVSECEFQRNVTLMQYLANQEDREEIFYYMNQYLMRIESKSFVGLVPPPPPPPVING